LVDTLLPLKAARNVINFTIESDIDQAVVAVILPQLFPGKDLLIQRNHLSLAKRNIKQHHYRKAEHTAHSGKIHVTAPLRLRYDFFNDNEYHRPGGKA
jgi:hypothetical protein